MLFVRVLFTGLFYDICWLTITSMNINITIITILIITTTTTTTTTIITIALPLGILGGGRGGDGAELLEELLQALGGTTCLTLLVYYGLVCFLTALLAYCG